MPKTQSMLIMLFAVRLSVPALLLAATVDEPINPEPRPVLTTNLIRWDFQTGVDDWNAEHQCQVAAENGRLAIESGGEDPFLHVPVSQPGGHLAVKLRLRTPQRRRGRVLLDDRQIAATRTGQAGPFPAPQRRPMARIRGSLRCARNPDRPAV